jgi:hypothetical protein
MRPSKLRLATEYLHRIGRRIASKKIRRAGEYEAQSLGINGADADGI